MEKREQILDNQVFSSTELQVHEPQELNILSWIYIVGEYQTVINLC